MRPVARTAAGTPSDDAESAATATRTMATTTWRRRPRPRTAWRTDKVDRDGDCDGPGGHLRPECCRLVRRVGSDLEPRPERRHRGEDEVVAVAPAEHRPK